MPKQRRAFGSVRKLPSGRYQARYTGPDGIMRTARRIDGGPMTFETKTDANAWLSMRHTEMLRQMATTNRPAQASPCDVAALRRGLARRARPGRPHP